jgi:hypothetical protein
MDSLARKRLQKHAFGEIISVAIEFDTDGMSNV